MAYQHNPNVPGVEALPQYLRQELGNLERGLNEASAFTELRVLAAAPKKLRPGMLVIADGVHWNSGSGEGLYRRDALNANWIFTG